MNKLAFLAFALFATPVFAAGAADQIAVQDAYVRLVPPGSQVTAAFMVLRNAGARDVQLIKVASSAAAKTELHNHTNDGGVMKMRPVAALAIKAKGEVALQPGSYHVMLIDLKAGLKEGDVVPLNLGFDDGSSKALEVKVMKQAPMAGHHHQH